MKPGRDGGAGAAQGEAGASGRVPAEWWWRRLVFAEFIEPGRGGQKVPNEYQTVLRRDGPAFLGQAGPDPLTAEQVLLARAHGCPTVLGGQFRSWTDEHELGAWRYELLRRCLPDRNLPIWTELHGFEYSWVMGALGAKHRSVMTLVHPLRPGPEWSEPIEPWQFELTASDKALTEVFMGWIEEQRRQHHLPDRVFPLQGKSGKYRSVNRGNRNRGVSWRAIELLDEGKRRRLVENERKIVEKARREAAGWREKFEQAWQQTRAYPNVKVEETGVNTYRRFLLEHFKERVRRRLVEFSPPN
jgi:hypothetical protein